jgi:hypothetical protein
MKAGYRFRTQASAMNIEAHKTNRHVRAGKLSIRFGLKARGSFERRNHIGQDS